MPEGNHPMTPMRLAALLSLALALQTPVFADDLLKTGLQSLPGPLPNLGPQEPAIMRDFDLAREKFFIAVPKNYTGSQPFGLLVFLHPVDQIAALPPDWAGVLEQRKLIFVAPRRTSATTSPSPAGPAWPCWPPPN